MNGCRPAESLRFVVQKHAARTLHYDFRLERDGVFRSWAVPKGVPEQAGEKRLAIQVEDHTLEFGDFEGTIADGEYGARQIEIWDRGRYEIGQWLEDTVQFTLHGQQFHTRGITLDPVGRRSDRLTTGSWSVFRSPSWCA